MGVVFSVCIVTRGAVGGHLWETVRSLIASPHFLWVSGPKLVCSS